MKSVSDVCGGFWNWGIETGESLHNIYTNFIILHTIYGMNFKFFCFMFSSFSFFFQTIFLTLGTGVLSFLIKSLTDFSFWLVSMDLMESFSWQSWVLGVFFFQRGLKNIFTQYSSGKYCRRNQNRHEYWRNSKSYGVSM